MQESAPRITETSKARGQSDSVVDELRAAFEGVPAAEIERETDRIVARLRGQEL